MTFRPSQMARIVACPASHRLSQGAPQFDIDADTSVRDDGSTCHWVAEHVLKGKAPPSVGVIGPFGRSVTADMHSAVQLYVDSIDVEDGACEQPLQMPQIHPDCNGTADFIGIDDSGVVHVYDLKYGFSWVKEWPNYQLAAYAVGAAAYFGVTPTAYKLTIVQPRVSRPVRSALVLAGELDAVVAEMYTATRSDGPANPGTHCKYCPARWICDDLRNSALGTKYITQIDTLQPAQAEQALVYLMRQQELVTTSIAALTQQLQHAGDSYQLRQLREVTTPGRLVWRDPDAAIAAGVPVVATPITPTQAKAAGVDITNLTERKNGTKKYILEK